MKKSYRVSKYLSPSLSKEQSNSEWTSYCDIGSKVTEDVYKYVEDQYLDFIDAIVKCSSMHTFSIEELENYDDLPKYHKRSECTKDEVGAITRDILREKIWCKIVSSKLQIHFGYDFYMYIIINGNASNCVDQTITKLNVEEFNSPYS